MKRCACCNTEAKDDVLTCLNCGEASWIDVEAKAETKGRSIAPKKADK